MRSVLLAAAVAAASLLGGRVQAHHSFAATYDESKKVTIEGDLLQFLWRNPHSFVHLMGKEEAAEGQAQRWAAEWGSGGQLGRQGVARDSLKVGDHIIVTGDPSRTPGDNRLRVRTIFRPSDGWRWGGEID
jgi:hypothetical protein